MSRMVIFGHTFRDKSDVSVSMSFTASNTCVCGYNRTTAPSSMT